MVKIICRIKPPKEDNVELITEKKINLYKKDKNLLDKSIIKPYQFELDKFYDYNINTVEIYQEEIKPKLEKDFGVFIYGHTGSGKTYTMFGNNTDKGIFDLISDEFDKDFELEALDLRYSGIYDLFSGEKLSLYSNGFEDICPKSKIKKITIDSYDSIKKIIMDSRTRGKSKHNNVSSRSHLVLYIYKNNKKYTIVDLAGNERKPSLFDKENELETSYINSSLLALKECFRSYGKSYMPYRRSDLTRLLKKIITNKNLIICTIHSGHPYFYDTIDTLNYIYSLINKIKTKPDFYERKILPMSPKNINRKKIPALKKSISNDSLSKKSSRIDSKPISPKKLFLSPNDLIESSQPISPENYKNLEPLDDLDSNIFVNNVAEEKFSKSFDFYDEKIKDDEEDEYEDDYDFEELDYNIDNDVKEISLKDFEKELERPIVKYDPYKDIKKNVNSRRKLIGIINNLLYKKIVSNYRVLLDENLDNKNLDELIYTTASTLEVSITELIKM